MKEPKNCFVYGTRPELIKMYPVIKRTEDKYVICTGQHKELLNTELFKPDLTLNVMKKGQNLDTLVNLLLVHLTWAFQAVKPKRIIVEGDTATAFVASLIAFHNDIQLAHMEAGLRTWDKNNPYPEEIYRRFITSVADIHFCPTWDNYRNIDIVKYTYHPTASVPGNTVVDALEGFGLEATLSNTFLITLHRRESDVEDYGQALRIAILRYPEFNFRVVTHPNKTGQELKRILGYGGEFNNLQLLEPLGYEEFLKELASCYAVLTDSGGVQEEAPCFNKPVVVMRKMTERLENIGRGATLARNGEDVLRALDQLVNDEKYYEEMANAKNPFGDGDAGRRIAEVLNGA
jgi:UDP-N-acetylglucosamine 2-epimerase (non-hydrolysing)